MRTSEALDLISAALAKAQGGMRPALKDATNPAYRSKYADLTAVWEACRGPLTSNGVAVLQDVTTSEEGIQVVTRLQHASGQWIELGPLTVPVSKKDAHGVGSATSYAKRYALSAAIGIVVDEDDDGNAAASAPPPPVPKGMDAKTIADFKAKMDEATTVEQLREITSKALNSAGPGSEAYKALRAYSIGINDSKFAKAA